MNIFLRRLISIIILFALCVAPLYMFKRNTNKSDLPQSKILRSEQPLLDYDYRLLDTSDDIFPYINETIIKKGDTLRSILQRLRVKNLEKIQNFITKNPETNSIRKLLPGRQIQVATDLHGNMIWLRYLHTPYCDNSGQIICKYLQISSNKEHSYSAYEKTNYSEKQIRVAFGVIKSSLFEATEQAGIPNFITIQMTNILSTKLDFPRDIRIGDQFRVIYELQMYDGLYLGSGKVLAIEFKSTDKMHNAIWFDNDRKIEGGYYNFNGDSLKKTFLNSAIKFSRISSRFGKRIHPIRKTLVDHKGVDYVAPAGTPIYATADGIVEFSGWQNGYGKVVILKHFNKYSTLYAHQSRIDPKIHKGKKVSQGQLIGYVGSTGWATGPHLHYELRINNKPVDPLSIKLPTSKKIDASIQNNFNNKVEYYKEQMRFLEKLQSESIKISYSK
ncbi:M23 family zinc metallopeptidase [Candidatus Kinetoplastibacterium blastocrithidii TCC012E]|uniref:M23 family zinc metallopeptidase n=3 Tax=Candidatus Kinetoplastidibacterium blastocrithidiae TaxID=233181 RepID=M1ME70_9PROT|nr:M23 family metallopeptidase [Candidatus Kinetoplastibacterium blastocrithidii]AGF50025.1 M23 family zinc metallopeptidase [Candidatus Kinetoplastibacterium blastocrithidii TCC012E]